MASIVEITRQSILEETDLRRIRVCKELDPERKASMGQFLTPAPVARFMASLFRKREVPEVRVLDPGAGIGSLTVAFVEEFCGRRTRPDSIEATAYELEPCLFDELDVSVGECGKISDDAGVRFSADMLREDFVARAAAMLVPTLMPNESDRKSFTHVIMNPPYKQIRSDSEYRALLGSMGVETGNLYTGFMWAAAQLLEPKGELVAIVPRSFCNGPYFRHFRHVFFREMAIVHLHTFESREEAFKDDAVLQENVILHAIKGGHRETVTITGSHGPDFENITLRNVDYGSVIRNGDSDCVIHIPATDVDEYAIERLNCLPCTLDDINVEVSTGRVVDFRCEEHLRWEKQNDCVPLLYPFHFDSGFLTWPKEGIKKANFLVVNKDTLDLLMPGDEFYTTVRRLSPKEEDCRIVAAIYDPHRIRAAQVAFENHLNVLHSHGKGLSERLAKGLAVFLSSSLVDICFRHFSGHTQVNASDLRMLRYPSLAMLERLGDSVGKMFPSKDEIDNLIEKELCTMAKLKTPNPVKAKKRIKEAIRILGALGFPRAQLNDRSALTLLALAGITPKHEWSQSQNELIGITPIMTFCLEHYGVQYAPNTRETFRRQTMHQFVQAGLAVENPDYPKRPVNSPKWVYQVSDVALELVRSFGSKDWEARLAVYLGSVQTLAKTYARERDMKMVPLSLPDGKKIKLTPGPHSDLIKSVITDFAPRFLPKGRPAYIGDTGHKWAFCDEQLLTEFGVETNTRGKMPDVVIYYPQKDWVVLFEVVTSHGPVDGKRRMELASLFTKVREKLIYVTCFPDRRTMSKYIGEISWETEVWAADAPTHLIHFNGERFLGPYEK
jgi:adenine-specific DNA-methyltransferase